MSDDETLYARSRAVAARLLRDGRRVQFRGELLELPEPRTLARALALIDEQCPRRRAGRPRTDDELAVSLTARVSPTTEAAIRRAAEDAGRTVSEEVRQALEERYR